MLLNVTHCRPAAPENDSVWSNYVIPMNDNHSTENYLSSCRSAFWKSVFDAEVDYLTAYLNGCADVLSVGCGPAVIEGILSDRGFNITGLDVSKEALRAAPDSVRTVQGPAEKMPFNDSSFDAVIFVVSLQFIEKPVDAIREAARVLKISGRLIALLLNPASSFFQDKMRQPDSYVRNIKRSEGVV